MYIAELEARVERLKARLREMAQVADRYVEEIKVLRAREELYKDVSIENAEIVIIKRADGCFSRGADGKWHKLRNLSIITETGFKAEFE